MEQKRVLVIEDETDILDVISYNLKRAGFEVLTAQNGSMGLFLIQNELPHLVLLDLMIPGVNGLEICQSIKSDKNLKDIPVIMISAKGEVADVVLGLCAGADDYIHKPFSTLELIARVHAVLRRVEGAPVREGEPANAGSILSARGKAGQQSGWPAPA